MRRNTYAAVLCGGLLVGTLALAAEPSGSSDPVVAQAGRETVGFSDVLREMQAVVRRRYYHGSVPESELAKVQREVLEDLIDRIVISTEARRRGVNIDTQAIELRIAKLEGENQGAPGWDDVSEELYAILRKRWTEDALKAELKILVEESVRDPAEKAVRTFYEQNPKLFTEPRQNRVSVIMFSVDPSSTSAEWEKRIDEARKIAQEIRAGKRDFAETARQYSGDEKTKSKGGDMGYLHEGMLSPQVESLLANMKPGEITDPTILLDGVAVVRLDDIKPSKLMPFASVRQRASDLWVRAEKERAWKELIAKLRKAAGVKINESMLLPMPEAVKSGK